MHVSFDVRYINNADGCQLVILIRSSVGAVGSIICIKMCAFFLSEIQVGEIMIIIIFSLRYTLWMACCACVGG